MSIVKKRSPRAAKPPRARAKRRRLPAEAARTALLEAAERVLTAKGPQDLKLSEVAKEAGVANGTVLHHFGTVEGLQGALMENLVKRLVDRVVAITEQPWSEDQRMTLGITEMFEAFESKSSSRIAAWLVMTDQVQRLSRVQEAIQRVLGSIEAASLRDPTRDISSQRMQRFVMLGILLALGSGFFGRDLSHLFGEEPTAAREAALDALLTLAAKA